MFNDLENGMVIGAQEEYDRMFADTPWDDRDDDSLIDWVNDEGKEADIIKWYLDADVDEDRAYTLFWHLDKKKQSELAERYIEFKDAEDKYDSWYNEKNAPAWAL